MELSIIKQLKELRQIAKRKPKCIVERKIVKKIKPTKSNKEPTKSKREQIKAVVDGRELSLSRIAQLYNLEPHTVYARYRVGNRGKLLIRPSNRTLKPT
jgi:hypothetical protein